MVDPVILNWTAHLDSGFNEETDEPYQTIIVKLNGHEVLREKSPSYVDEFGDGGADLEEAAVEMIATRLRGGFSHG